MESIYTNLKKIFPFIFFSEEGNSNLQFLLVCGPPNTRKLVVVLSYSRLQTFSILLLTRLPAFAVDDHRDNLVTCTCSMTFCSLGTNWLELFPPTSNVLSHLKVKTMIKLVTHTQILLAPKAIIWCSHCIEDKYVIKCSNFFNPAHSFHYISFMF